MPALNQVLRKSLKEAIKAAREVAEEGSRAALEQLAVQAPEPYAHLDSEQRALRNALRARARQLGDKRDPRAGAHQIEHLIAECAYEHWHRMLFARFLADNGVLMANSAALGLEETSVTLRECDELADAEGAVNGWELAGRYASAMLPQIFRPDAPVLAVRLPPENQHRLEKLLGDLDTEVFLGSDALGWVYQFWQEKKKAEVRASGAYIGADELPSVTQLFTEPYMVNFVVDNTVGAWWAKRVLEERPGLAHSAADELELREACRLPRRNWTSLRFARKGDTWHPAMSAIGDWPQTLSEFRVLDPCCGSGHFLIAVFDALVAVRSQYERISVKEAVARVITENIAGLDVDRRVTEIAAFAVALAAWTLPGAGYGRLPRINIACSGIAPRSTKEEWLSLCGGDNQLENTMTRLYRMFREAPTLGSLIEPDAVGRQGDWLPLEADFQDSKPALRAALIGKESGADSRASTEMVIAAHGIYVAAELLTQRYDLVLTNVPYLTHTLMGETLRDYCAEYFPNSKSDLATVMQERCGKLLKDCGTLATVLPSNWMSYTKYFQDFRVAQLEGRRWDLVALLGKHAYETISGEVVDVCLHLSSSTLPSEEHEVVVVDAREEQDARGKAAELITGPLTAVLQLDNLRNPAAAFYVSIAPGQLLSSYVTVYEGLSRGDVARFDRCFWEVAPDVDGCWKRMVDSPASTGLATGRSSVFLWGSRSDELISHPSARVQGLEAWGKPAVVVSRSRREMYATPSYGDAFAQNCVAIVPDEPEHLDAVWHFCQSEEYRAGVRALNQKLVKPTGVMDKVAFDLVKWTQVSSESERVPEDLPFSSDPTQWSFAFHADSSPHLLDIATAWMLGFSWPKSPVPQEASELVDTDGIVCIPSVRGEPGAVERLEELLTRIYGAGWSAGRRDECLKLSGAEGRDLKWWIDNKFFENHCKLFQQRPFLWHIWDGHKNGGFGALINYHKLDRKLLEALTYSYLGDWIRRQQDELARNVAGADARLEAATRLQRNLESIIEGESPLDIFVRWKPLHEQPIGWEPDLCDGVRVNIRPFMSAPDVSLSGAGVLRWRPNITWGKDVGTEPREAPWFHLGETYGQESGVRINDHHLDHAEKRAARAAWRAAE